MLFYIFFTIYIRARPGCKKFVKMMFYVELRIDSAPPVRSPYRGCRISLHLLEEGPNALPVVGVENLPALGFFVPVFLKLLEVIHLQLSAFLLAPDKRPILVEAFLDDFKGHRATEVVATDRKLEQFGGGSVIHQRRE